MIAVILVLALVLRVINLNQSFWLDEAISVVAIQGNTFWELLFKFLPGDVHPPLYYLLLKVWDGVFGYSEMASRFPSVIFGVATTYLIYLIGKQISGWRVGVLAAFFWAVNPLAVYYSQEARMYAMVAFLGATAVYFFLAKKWWLFLAVILLAVYTDYLAFLMLPVFWLVTTEKRRLVKIYLAVTLLYLPWLPVFGNQLKLGTALAIGVPAWGQVVGGLSLKAVGLVWVKFIIGRITFDNKYIYALILAGISAGYSYILARTRNRLLWAWLIVPVALGIVIALRVPVFAYHRFLFVLPAFVLLLALGAKKWWMVGLVVVVSLGSLSYFNFNPRFWREDWRAAAGYIQSAPGTVVMPSLAQSAPLVYYGVDLDQKLRPTVYLFRYVQELFDPGDVAKKRLEGYGYKITEQRDFNGVLVWKYQI